MAPFVRWVTGLVLDVVGLLLVAAGIGWGLFAVIGPWSLLVAGLVLLGGSYAADESPWPDRARDRAEQVDIR